MNKFACTTALYGAIFCVCSPDRWFGHAPMSLDTRLSKTTAKKQQNAAESSNTTAKTAEKQGEAAKSSNKNIITAEKQQKASKRSKKLHIAQTSIRKQHRIERPDWYLRATEHRRASAGCAKRKQSASPKGRACQIINTSG